jgi:hypothetical protein
VSFLAPRPGHVYQRDFIDVKSAVLGWPEVPQCFGWAWWREAEPGPYADDAFRVPQRAEQVLGHGLVLDLSGDSDDA